MIEIKLFQLAGSFSENKDIARTIRIDKVVPALEAHQEVVLNFEGVDSATQSFIHALISDLMRKYGSEVLDKIYFKACNEMLQKVINIVIEYMQESE